ncbi:MAG: flagellar motor switch protein FliN [Bryobacteraceae bacterium]
MQTDTSSRFRELVDLLDDLFTRSLGQSVSSLIGEDVEVTSGTPAGQDSTPLRFEWDLKPASYGMLWFGGPRQLWLELGKTILGDDSDPDPDLIDSTLKEIASQVAGSITTFLNHQYQKQIEAGEVRITEGALNSNPGAKASFHKLLLPNGKAIPVSFCVAESLFQSMLPPKETEETLPALPVDTKKLELLLDVEMPVSVSIGRAQMPLKDVIKLTTGSVVELSRNVSEPVDIIVNNCVVARGDVVVVEGNFGVRIREVLSKEDRMRRLTPR